MCNAECGVCGLGKVPNILEIGIKNIFNHKILIKILQDAIALEYWCLSLSMMDSGHYTLLWLKVKVTAQFSVEKSITASFRERIILVW